MKMLCPDEGAIQSYIDGELSQQEMELTSLHLKDCPACQKELRRISAADEWLIPILTAESSLVWDQKSHRPLSLSAARNEARSSSLVIVALVGTLLFSVVGPWIMGFLAGSLGVISWVATDPITDLVWIHVLKVISGSTFLLDFQKNVLLAGAFWSGLFMVALNWKSYYQRKITRLNLN